MIIIFVVVFLTHFHIENIAKGLYYTFIVSRESSWTNTPSIDEQEIDDTSNNKDDI